MHGHKSSFLPWFTWFLGAFFYFYENLIQVSPGVMVHDLMHALSLDAAQLGVLAGVYFYTYAFIQIPAGILADHYDIRFLLATAVSFCILGCLLFARSHGMMAAVLGRLLIGLGSGFAAICSMKLATFLFPAKKFPFLVGLMITLGMTGSILGEGPLAVVVDQLGWRDSMSVLAAVGVLLFLLILRFVRGKSPQKRTNNHSMLHGLRQVLVCKQSWYLAIYGGLMFAPTSIFGGLWGVPFIMQKYSLQKPIAASLVSLLFLGWVIGGPLTGLIAEKMLKKHPMLLAGSLGAVLAMSAILYLPAGSLVLLGIFIFLFGVFSSCFLPSFSVIKEIHADENAGAALGFMNTANMIGGAIGLPLVGLLLNQVWAGEMLNQVKVYSTTNYVVALSILPLMILFSLGLTLLIREK